MTSRSIKKVLRKMAFDDLLPKKKDEIRRYYEKLLFYIRLSQRFGIHEDIYLDKFFTFHHLVMRYYNLWMELRRNKSLSNKDRINLEERLKYSIVDIFHQTLKIDQEDEFFWK